MSNTLDYWLGVCYAADVMGKGDLSEMVALFKKRLTPGNSLEAEARKRLPQCEAVKDRCFISRKHLYYLQMALN